MNELFRSNSSEHPKDATSPDRKYSIDALHCRTVNTSWRPLTPNSRYQYRRNLQVEAFLYNACSFPSVCQTVPNWVSHDSLLNDMFLTTTKQVLRLEKDTRKSFTEICKVKLDTCYVNAFVKLQCNWQDMWHSFKGRGRTESIKRLHRRSFTIPNQHLPLSHLIPISAAPLEVALLFCTGAEVPVRMIRHWDLLENLPRWQWANSREL